MGVGLEGVCLSKTTKTRVAFYDPPLEIWWVFQVLKVSVRLDSPPTEQGAQKEPENKLLAPLPPAIKQEEKRKKKKNKKTKKTQKKKKKKKTKKKKKKKQQQQQQQRPS